jgi:hypothetical protein
MPSSSGRFFLRKFLWLFAVASLILLAPSTSSAHHGVAGYDLSKTVTVHGTVTKFDWANPHVCVYVDAKNEAGDLQHWTIEFAAPAHLMRAGWNKNVMKPGDDVVIETHPARNGAPVGITSTIEFILKVTVNGQPLPTRGQ